MRLDIDIRTIEGRQVKNDIAHLAMWDFTREIAPIDALTNDIVQTALESDYCKVATATLREHSVCLESTT